MRPRNVICHSNPRGSVHGKPELISTNSVSIRVFCARLMRARGCSNVCAREKPLVNMYIVCYTMSRAKYIFQFHRRCNETRLSCCYRGYALHWKRIRHIQHDDSIFDI